MFETKVSGTSGGKNGAVEPSEGKLNPSSTVYRTTALPLSYTGKRTLRDLNPPSEHRVYYAIIEAVAERGRATHSHEEGRSSKNQ